HEHRPPHPRGRRRIAGSDRRPPRGRSTAAGTRPARSRRRPTGPQRRRLLAAHRPLPRRQQAGGPQEVRARLTRPIPRGSHPMTTTDTPARRPLLRRPPDTGPRASFRELLPYLREHTGLLSVAVVLSLVAAGLSLAQPALVSQVITVVQDGGAVGTLAWVLVALVIGNGVVGAVQHYLLQRAGTSVVYSSRRALVERMLRLPISEFDTRRTGDLVSRVGSDTTLLYAVLTQGLVDALGGAVVFVGALIGMAIIDPVLLGATALVIPLAIAVVGGLSGRIRRASREQQEKVGDVAAGVQRAISAIRTVRAANATARETAAIERSTREA